MFSGPAGSGPRGSLRPTEDSGPPSPGRALNLPAPTDMDDLLQNGKGGLLKAVVDAANSRAPESVFLKEETVQYGPVVTRPEKPGFPRWIEMHPAQRARFCSWSSNLRPWITPNRGGCSG